MQLKKKHRRSRNQWILRNGGDQCERCKRYLLKAWRCPCLRALAKEDSDQ
jgi:hypothetical protein